MAKQKLLFVGDSLSLPRFDGSVIDSQTWCSVVSQRLNSKYDFFYQLYPGLTSREFINRRLQGPLGGFRPDTLILQVGIVDCCPRVLSQRQLFVVSHIPLLGRVIYRLISKYHNTLLRLRSTTYVSLNEFRRNMESFKKSFGNTQIWVIPIAPANYAYQQRIPGIARNIELYNQVLASVFSEGFIENAYDNMDIDKLFLSDNHHFSVYGHSCLAELIIKKLGNEIS